MKLIISALIKAQANIGSAAKDATNPHFKNKYATLESVIEAVKGPLLAEKITIVHSQGPDDTLITSLYHESGECLQTSSKLLLDRQNMQSLGSAQTYAKRYNLTSLLNLPTEDDDGNAATGIKDPINTQKALDGAKKESVTDKDSGTGQYKLKNGYNQGKKLIDLETSYIKESVEKLSKISGIFGALKDDYVSMKTFLEKVSKKAEPKLNESEEIPF